MRRACSAALLLLCACVAPARSYGAYEGKAASTAEEAASAAQTAIVAVLTAQRSHAFAPAITVALAEAEKDASSVQGIFDSIQPPDDRSDRLREQLDGLLEPLTGTLGDLRIAIRRGKLAELPKIAEPLHGLAQKLQDFAEQHG